MTRDEFISAILLLGATTHKGSRHTWYETPNHIIAVQNAGIEVRFYPSEANSEEVKVWQAKISQETLTRIVKEMTA